MLGHQHEATNISFKMIDVTPDDRCNTFLRYILSKFELKIGTYILDKKQVNKKAPNEETRST